MLLYKRRVKIIMERIIEIDLIDKYDLVEKYNENHGTHLTYGQYTALTNK